MNKKYALFGAVLIFILFLNSFSLAALNATQETESVNKGYNWLSGIIKDKWTDLSVEDASFALLALAYDDALAAQGKDALLAKGKSGECWPSSACRLKDTALATLALTRIGYDTQKSEEWLMRQNGTPTDLTWFLQMDSTDTTNCTIGYDGKEYGVKISERKKLDKAAGACLSLSLGNYWLKISPSCFDRTFTISCDKDFVSSLIYQRPGAPTVYVSSDTKKESASGVIDIKLNAICLKEAGSCDYEGTAWGAFALVKNQDISTFIPYLVGYAEKYEKLQPDAFLYALTGNEDYAKALISQQKLGGYWSAGGSTSKFYDTALTLLSLNDYDDDKKGKAKEYLLKEQAKTGTDEGSWLSNKKDTSFLLYALWPKEPSYQPPEENLQCEDYGYFCENSFDCDPDDRIDQYLCPGLQVCCSAQNTEPLRTCNEYGGEFCDPDESCNAETRSSSDGLCCLGSCERDTTEANECEDQGLTCSYACSEDEQESSYTCAFSSGKLCCESKVQSTKSKSKIWIFFIIIFILIALGVAAYFFRDKLKFNKKKPLFAGGIPGFGRPGTAGPPSRGPPGFPSSAPPGRMVIPSSRPPMMPNIPAVRAPPTVPSRALPLKKSQTDKDLEETVKKLKEISGDKEKNK